MINDEIDPAYRRFSKFLLPRDDFSIYKRFYIEFSRLKFF